MSGSTCKGALVMEKDVDAYSGGVADMAEGVAELLHESPATLDLVSWVWHPWAWQHRSEWGRVVKW